MQQKKLFYFLNFIAGLLLPLAFAPFSFYPLAILMPAFLLFSWNYVHIKPRQAFFSGWFFGLGFFGAGVSWVFISIHVFGHAPIILGITITGLLVTVLALFHGVQGYFLNKFFPKVSLIKNLSAFSLSWILLEWVRGWILTGFPWLFLGYSQIDTPLKSIAPIFGVYGVSFIVVFMSGLIASFFAVKKIGKFLIVVSLLIIWFFSIGLNSILWVRPTGEKTPVSLIQGNIPLSQKWDIGEISNILETYRALSSKNWRSKLIVWPEAAVPTLEWQASDYLLNLDKLARKHKAFILTGVIYQPKNSEKYYNGMLALGGKTQNVYLKKHLVPFGEFLPFKSCLFWLLKFINIPESDFTAGANKQGDFVVGDFYVAPFICYEIAYPSLPLRYLPKAEFLVTISEDSWFGKSLAAAQHLEIAQMRSLEVGRYQLVATNSGITAIINAKGEVVSKLSPFTQRVLNGELEIMKGITPWVSFGHYLWLILAVLGLVISMIKVLGTRSVHPTK